MRFIGLLENKKISQIEDDVRLGVGNQTRESTARVELRRLEDLRRGVGCP